MDSAKWIRRSARSVIALDPLPIVYFYSMSEPKVPVEAEKDIADFSGARISRKGPLVAIEAAQSLAFENWASQY